MKKGKMKPQTKKTRMGSRPKGNPARAARGSHRLPRVTAKVKENMDAGDRVCEAEAAERLQGEGFQMTKNFAWRTCDHAWG